MGLGKCILCLMIQFLCMFLSLREKKNCLVTEKKGFIFGNYAERIGPSLQLSGPIDKHIQKYKKHDLSGTTDF